MFVGYGRLGETLVSILPQESAIKVYTRSKEKVLNSRTVHANVRWIDKHDFKYEHLVWLLLPAEQMAPFIKEHLHLFGDDVTFYYCATKGLSKELKPLLLEKQTVVPVKFIAQTDQLKKDGKGMLAIPPTHNNQVPYIRSLFQDRMEIVFAEEEDVYTLNKAATRMAIETVTSFAKEMESIGVPNNIIEHAARQIIPGVIHSYFNGSLGGFAQSVLRERSLDGEDR